MAQELDVAAARRVLAVVMDQAARPSDQSIGAIAENAEMLATDVLGTLRALAELDPPVVHREHDAALDIEFWFAIEPGASKWLDETQED